VERGGKATQPAVTRNGFLLDGWYLTPEGEGRKWDFDTDTVEEDLDLHARWTELPPDRVAVTFDADGGSPVPPQQSVALGDNAAKPADPEKVGFEFDGWFKDGSVPWDFETDPVEEAITLRARWTAVYTVAFDLRGGAAADGGDLLPVTLRTGSKLAKPEDPVRGQDRFDGWHSVVTNTPWDFDGPVTGSFTLYAVWTPVWTVRFDAQGGLPAPAPQAALDGETIAQPENPTKANNTFAGWHTNEAYTEPWDFAADTVEADITLYAKWTALVHFDANGGTNAPADQIVTSGSPVSAPANPTLERRSFGGWHTHAAQKNRWDFDSDTVDGHMTLYAKWEIIPVTGINNIPREGIVNEALDLSAAKVVPANASATDIVWTVNETKTTATVSVANGVFTPESRGTLTLTAAITGGGVDAVDYVQDFPVTITAIRKVTAIRNVPTNGLVGVAVDLSGATVIPANATHKAIVWSVKTPGAGVTTISGNAFTPAAVGSLVLTATVVDGDEDDDTGLVHDYVEDFAVVVDEPIATQEPGSVGMGEDTTIKLSDAAGPLSAGSVTPVAQGSAYYVYVPATAGYTDFVWHLNGRRSTATGNRLYLDTSKPGTVKVTVEATKNGAVDTGTHAFKIE
jgi:uncharacterized repeat protein (TIGR02543 family)